MLAGNDRKKGKLVIFVPERPGCCTSYHSSPSRRQTRQCTWKLNSFSFPDISRYRRHFPAIFEVLAVAMLQLVNHQMACKIKKKIVYVSQKIILENLLFQRQMCLITELASFILPLAINHFGDSGRMKNSGRKTAPMRPTISSICCMSVIRYTINVNSITPICKDNQIMGFEEWPRNQPNIKFIYVPDKTYC